VKRTLLSIVCVALCGTYTTHADSKLHYTEEFSDNGDFVTANGMWRVENPTKETEVILSETRIECYKTGGTRIVGRNAYCMQATASIILDLPAVQVDYYPVVSWDKERIIAADSTTAQIPICTWTQITIDLQNKIVTATDTRKPGRSGWQNSCEKLPQTQTYYLLDKTSEIVRRTVKR
jgi:hypothetical protein